MIVYIAPSTKSIRGMIQAELGLRKAEAELCANALDQNARHIDLTLTENTFSIYDDGNGCSDLTKMLRLGEHFATHAGQTIGKFGVGFKDAVIWLGDMVRIDSMTETGHKMNAFADWQQMIQSDEWAAEVNKGSQRVSPGVTITVGELRKTRLKPWNLTASYISELFSAAIDDGIIFTVNGVTVKSVPLPELQDIQEFHGTFGGRRFEAICGILVDRRTAKSGWEIRYGYQTIVKGYQREGFGDYSPQGFFGRLLLKDDSEIWTLSRNKGDVEELADVLNCKDVQELIRPILEKLKDRSETLQMRLNQKTAESICQRLLMSIKTSLSDESEEGGTRNGKGNSKTGKPGKGGTRKKRKEDPEGAHIQKLHKAQEIRLCKHTQPDQYGLGYVDITERGRIIKIFIDASTEFGKSLWMKVDEGAALSQHAIALFAQHCGLTKEQLTFPFAIAETTEDEVLRISKIWLEMINRAELHVIETLEEAV